MNDERAMLRHFLAALAYRTQKALRDAPPDFGEFRAGHDVRTPTELGPDQPAPRSPDRVWPEAPAGWSPRRE